MDDPQATPPPRESGDAQTGGSDGETQVIRRDEVPQPRAPEPEGQAPTVQHGPPSGHPGWPGQAPAAPPWSPGPGAPPPYQGPGNPQFGGYPPTAYQAAPPWGGTPPPQAPPWGGPPQQGAGQPWYPPPADAPPPAPVGPPRSRWAAGLLNLTGLGLGYVYLGKTLRFALAIVITVLLLVVAFVTHAASTPWPWRIGLLVWVVACALDAVRLARRTPRPENSTRPVLVAVGAVVVLVACLVLYGVGQHNAYADGTAAMARGDCGAAASSFDAVTGPYRLTLGSEVPAAATRRTECDQFTAAGAGDRSAVISGFEAFRRDHPDSPLLPFANGRLGDAYLDQVADLQKTLADQNGDARATSTRTAFETLLTIKRELPSTDAAAKVPSTMTGLFAAAEAPFAKQQYCDVLPVLEYAVTLPAAETGSVVGTANVHRAQSLLGCGLAEFNAGHYPGATTVLQKLISAYPADGGVPQARAALIAADVAAKTTDPIPLPAPIDRPGSMRVVVYNLSPDKTRVEIAGSSAADITLPGCQGCPATYPPGSGCPDGPEGKPQQSVQLDPGLYHFLFTYGDGKSNVGTPFTPIDGDQICVLTRDSGGIPGGT